MRNKREQPAADLDARVEALSVASAFQNAASDPEEEFFGRLIDDRVIEAIDALPEEFREVLVLSDLGDLEYNEISQVLDIPVGTVKSRLFRARRLLQDRLREFAVESSYVQEMNRRYPQYDFQRAYFEFVRRVRDRDHAPPSLRRRLFRLILERESSIGNGS